VSDSERDLAHRYAQYVAPTFVTLTRRAVDLAEIENGNSVLDLATGTGLGAFLAAERAGRDGSIVGLDRSPAMLAVAHERSSSVGYDYIHWQQGDPAALTFADESFDVVLCVQELGLMPRVDATVEEVRRVLVEGGRFIVTLWGPRSQNEWFGVLEDALRRAVPNARPPSLGLSQPGNLEVLLQAIGFEEIEVARVPDRMRLQGIEAFWGWSQAIGPWSEVIAAMPTEQRERMRSALDTLLSPRLRDGELAIEREIVYARAVAPAAP
jgi:ubiquinone/menaquinone biosynthesis C-methylase UbiE